MRTALGQEPEDYYSGSDLLSPTHQTNVSACPCFVCVRKRVAGFAIRAQTEAVRFILHLRWLRWVTKRDRKDWPGLHTPPEEVDDED